MNNFNELDNIIYKIVKDKLYEMVPEYSYYENGETGIYFFMNEFNVSLINEIEDHKSNNFIDNSFELINYLGESNNLEILNIIKVGILEILYTSENLDRKKIEELLSEKLRPIFRNFSNYYY
ncbi:DUF7674 family protein [Empedobacter brevis]|uniref:DUF7674 family protein n=1 Tax=Empedobacter brevis TaxID=247 RepID=UPI0023F2426C|nr:hypothetical protein [Empedobacter brevis]